MWLIVKEIKRETLDFVFHSVFIKYTQFSPTQIESRDQTILTGIRAQDFQQVGVRDQDLRPKLDLVGKNIPRWYDPAIPTADEKVLFIFPRRVAEFNGRVSLITCLKEYC